MWPRRRLCDLLGIEHPIIQAPMAGSATPELASAVSNAGGLGFGADARFVGAESQARVLRSGPGRGWTTRQRRGENHSGCRWRVSLRRPGRGHQAWALRLHGEIVSRGDSPDLQLAESHYRRAVVLAEELGMRPLAAHCHLGLGSVYRRSSEPGRAEQHAATARAMYDEMGMSFWLEKAQAAMGRRERGA